MTTQVDVLKHARAAIEGGWTRGTEHIVIGGNDHFCLLGAVKDSDAPAHVKGAALSRLSEAIPEKGHRNYRWNGYTGTNRVWRFNDTQTDKRRVLTVLNRAIKAAEKRVK